MDAKGWNGVADFKIRKVVFQRFIRHLAEDLGGHDMRFHIGAIFAFQHAGENYAIELFRRAAQHVKVRKKRQVLPHDVLLAHAMQKDATLMRRVMMWEAFATTSWHWRLAVVNDGRLRSGFRLPDEIFRGVADHYTMRDFAAFTACSRRLRGFDACYAFANSCFRVARDYVSCFTWEFTGEPLNNASIWRLARTGGVLRMRREANKVMRPMLADFLAASVRCALKAARAKGRSFVTTRDAVRSLRVVTLPCFGFAWTLSSNQVAAHLRPVDPVAAVVTERGLDHPADPADETSYADEHGPGHL